jgi:hypothetical protein
VKYTLACSAVLILAALAACNNETGIPSIPAQQWKEMDVRIETRPNPPAVGKSEIIVIVTAARGRPVHDLIISLRTSDSAPWVQTIQDGHIGVYRRGLHLGSGESVVLQVLLQHRDGQNVLLFPLKLSAD